MCTKFMEHTAAHGCRLKVRDPGGRWGVGCGTRSARGGSAFVAAGRPIRTRPWPPSTVAPSGGSPGWVMGMGRVVQASATTQGTRVFKWVPGQGYGWAWAAMACKSNSKMSSDGASCRKGRSSSKGSTRGQLCSRVGDVDVMCSAGLDGSG